MSRVNRFTRAQRAAALDRLAKLPQVPLIAARSVVFRRGARIVSHSYPEHTHRVELAQLGQRIAGVWMATRDEHAEIVTRADLTRPCPHSGAEEIDVTIHYTKGCPERYNSWTGWSPPEPDEFVCEYADCACAPWTEAEREEFEECAVDTYCANVPTRDDYADDTYEERDR